MAPPKPPTCPALPCRRLCPSPTRGWRRRSTTTTPSAPSSGGWGRVLRHKQFPESCTACLRWEKCQHPHFPPPTPLLPACLPPKPAPRSIRCFLPACLLQPTNQQTNPTPPSALAAGTWAWSRTSWVRASWTPCCSSPSRWESVLAVGAGRVRQELLTLMPHAAPARPAALNRTARGPRAAAPSVD